MVVDRAATYDPSLYPHLAPIEERHFWFRGRNSAIGAIARRICASPRPGRRVLEVGCGTGNVLRQLERACPDALVIGTDLFAAGLVHARARTGCPLVQADIRTPPFSARFDLIGLFDVLEHLPDDVAVLRALRGLLAPDGALVLTVPAHAWLWSYFDVASRHCRRYAVGDLERKLGQAGYRVEYLSQYMCAILPLVWIRRRLAVRAVPAATAGGADTLELATEELRIWPIVNGLLTWLLEREARLVARGRHLPFGTSLIVLARPA
jgi:SAM-dependent methyltransferase